MRETQWSWIFPPPEPCKSILWLRSSDKRTRLLSARSLRPSPMLQLSSRQLPTYSLTSELNLRLGPPSLPPPPPFCWWPRWCGLPRRVRMSPDPETIWCALVGFFRTAPTPAAIGIADWYSAGGGGGGRCGVGGEPAGPDPF